MLLIQIMAEAKEVDLDFKEDEFRYVLTLPEPSMEVDADQEEDGEGESVNESTGSAVLVEHADAEPGDNGARGSAEIQGATEDSDGDMDTAAGAAEIRRMAGLPPEGQDLDD